MQNREYTQIYEMGLGSLIGDFFQNVKDTVTGVARAVAPVAPYVLPFIPGIGPVAQLGIGAGLGLASGQKPSEVAKNLAIQTALTGITGGFSKGATKAPVNTGAATVPTVTPAVASDTAYANELLGFFNDPKNVPNVVPSNLLPTGIESVDPTFFQTAVDKTKDFFTEGIGARLNPFSDASKFKLNPAYSGMDKALIDKIMQNPFAPEISAELRPELCRYPPFSNFFISYAADGGEMTGGVANNGQRIEHPNGKVKEHPRRIGEIAGPGTGTSDDIPAMLSDGEFVMTAQAVRNAGGGSRKAGAKNMYKLMKNLEKGGSLSEQSLGIVGRA